MKYTFVDEDAQRIYGGVIEPATEGSGGFDLRVHSFQSNGVIGTGVKMAIPARKLGMLNVRSSIGFKHGYHLANAIGYIDSDYRGEIMVRLAKAEPVAAFVPIHYNAKNGHVIDQVGAKCMTHLFPRMSLEVGQRFAQISIVPVDMHSEYVDSLEDTDRGHGGMGSTG